MAAVRNTSTAAGVEALPPPEQPGPRWTGWLWARVCLVLTAVLHTAAFPPYKMPEGAWVFAAPVALWVLVRPPRWREFLVVTYGAMFVSWLILLEWLRVLTREAGPVALLGWVALAAVVALFPTAWFAAVRAALPRVIARDSSTRLLVMLGLAGLWVVLEWVRSWFLTGFPWLPLAASQWQRPLLLQTAAYGGAWVVSFTLVVFNLGLAAYLLRLHLWVKERRGRFCPEFYLAILLIFFISFGFFGEVSGQQRQPLLNAGFVQPYIPQSQKWDPAEARQIMDVLQAQTRRLAGAQPDAVFWPEAVAPLVIDDPGLLPWIEGLSREVKAPIVLGALAVERGATPADITWLNGAFIVDPDIGLQTVSYYKRHLVPFGEYVPLRRWLPFIGKLVPIGGDFGSGNSAHPLTLRAAGRETRLGVLICFEDIFPGLARDSARAGADLLFVATNNAWFGETGAAYQHAAHSVLRAVETRRPVLRAGNGGWSGFIDEYGYTRAVLRDANHSVYYRGGDVYSISRDARWEGKQTVYVRWGDWFVALSAALAVGAGAAIRRQPLRPLDVPPPAAG